jgi:hypothetical protein
MLSVLAGICIVTELGIDNFFLVPIIGSPIVLSPILECPIIDSLYIFIGRERVE